MPLLFHFFFFILFDCTITHAGDNALLEKGYKVEKVGNNLKYLLVNGCIAVGDNLETDLGQVYNVTSTLSELTFDEILKVGRIVRQNVEVARVIVFAGENSSIESIKAAAEEKEGTYMGINAPKSRVYEKDRKSTRLNSSHT